ncbi:GIY-YIG nuclease family protein [Pseudoxanthomonas winnipegensis]|uniref:GIY-YIG nuclease family protein n=1 Tax=Pseudoxanthomonas winnipegensis TaxID=2480810 RepID=A0A4V2HD31_9GAMM|nr:GIY-YIG nuclease family protein [Pseudoxanthomonas winnipegensis]TAA25426.1 GIY-YIG nuclease family protein [Pseudoxanthomonas winnipegensis]
MDHASEFRRQATGTPRLPRTVGHVYVIEAKGRIKVGRSQRPIQRIRGLVSQSGLTETRHFISVLHEGYQATEIAVHTSLASFRIVGEWFACSFDAAVTTVLSALADVGECSNARCEEIRSEEITRAELASLALRRLFDANPLHSQTSLSDVPNARHGCELIESMASTLSLSNSEVLALYAALADQLGHSKLLQGMDLQGLLGAA